MPNTPNILTVLADNQALMDAVRLVLTKQFDLPKQVDSRADDTLLGQQLRAHTAGIAAIENAFKEISQYKTVTESATRQNPAR